MFTGGRHQLDRGPQDDKNYLIEQLSKFIEEQARLRFQQQIHQKQNAIPQEITGPGFSFVLPPMTKAEFNNKGNSEPIQFAVQPFDSRYYETTEGEEVVDGFEEPSNNRQESIQDADFRGETKTNILIPPPMHVVTHESGTGDKILHRAQQKLARAQQAAPDVMQKPVQVEFDNTMSLYIVALIAGLSCAFSTGVSYCTINLLSNEIDVNTFLIYYIADCTWFDVLDAL